MMRGRRGRDRMVVGFANPCAVSVVSSHHVHEWRYVSRIQHYVSDQVCQRLATDW
jgi:hypothetical protein